MTLSYLGDNMGMIKKILIKVPFILQLWRIYSDYRLKRMKREDIFTEIYRKKLWGADESASGSGSTIVQTRLLERELPRILDDMKILTVLDIPCGDFRWMGNMLAGTRNLDNICFIGADIVKDLVIQNTGEYGKENIHFSQLNILEDDLPKVDLIICRDCLVHFSYNDIFSALKNICRSKSTYLLATTFTAHKGNHDILTGKWREINLIAPPFDLPAPLRIINEGCSEGNGKYSDKSLGLWRIEDIAAMLSRI
jgi:hypothetical protein